MKNTYFLILISLLAVSVVVISGCSNKEMKDNNDKIDIESIIGIKLEVSEDKNINNLVGFGAEWDPHFWVNFNQKHGLEDSDWELIKNRVSEMKLQKMRVMVLPEWYEPLNDNENSSIINWDKFNFDTEHMRSLLKQLDLAEEQGIIVNLTLWGADTRIKSWLAFPKVAAWISAPNDLEEWAENISALIQFLIHEKKYTCVQEVTLYNEPDWASYNNENKVSFDYYVDMVKEVDTRLKSDGVRDRIKLNLSDDAQNDKWFMNTVQNLGEIGDIFNSHNYKYSSEDSNTQIYEWMSERVKNKEKFAPGKPFIIGEFGTNKMVDAYHQTDIDTYERGIHYAKMAINLLNGGGAGASAWVLFDQYYYDGAVQSAKMNLGLWGFKDEQWRVRPIYHSWGLITRYTRVGSEIYEVISDNEFVKVAALKSPDNKWTYLIVNSGDIKQDFTIVNMHLKQSEMSKYVFSKNTLPENKLTTFATVPGSTLIMSKLVLKSILMWVLRQWLRQ